jgi:hypothetical protein
MPSPIPLDELAELPEEKFDRTEDASDSQDKGSKDGREIRYRVVRHLENIPHPIRINPVQ